MSIHLKRILGILLIAVLVLTAAGFPSAEAQEIPRQAKDSEKAAAAAPVTCSAVPALVEIPMGIVEGGRSRGPAVTQEGTDSRIMIRYGEFRITVGDHFSSESLRRVLEVVARA